MAKPLRAFPVEQRREIAEKRSRGFGLTALAAQDYLRKKAKDKGNG